MQFKVTPVDLWDKVDAITDSTYVMALDGNEAQLVKASALGGEGGSVPEAPKDGKQYARQDGTWTEIYDVDLHPSNPLNSVQFNDNGNFGGDGDFTYEKDVNRLNVGNYSSSSDGEIVVGGSGTGVGKVTGGGGKLVIQGGDLELSSNPTHRISFKTNGTERASIDNDGTFKIDGNVQSGTNTGDQDLSGLQTSSDSSLETIDKTITGAINEVNSLAKGAQQAVSFDDYATLTSDVNSWTLDDVFGNIGQSLYIRLLNVPDLWIFDKLTNHIPYVYVDDETFVNSLDTVGYVQIGYYLISKLETSKLILTDYVPYTGATDAVDLGENNLKANGLAIDTVTPYTVTTPGEIGWNANQGTFDFHLNNGTILQAGQELHIYGKATENISNGDVVQLIGSQGGHLTIKRAVHSEILVNPNKVIGIATQNIANGNFGYVTNFGEVNDTYTYGFTEGDSIYYNTSGSTPGLFTNIKPQAPNPIIRLGSVLKAQTGASENGKLGIRISYSTKLEDLTNVDGTPLTITGQILVWDNTRQVFDFTDNINNYVTTTVFNNTIGNINTILDSINGQIL